MRKVFIPFVAAVITIAAVLAFRSMLDPGLQAVQQEGLVTELNRSAQSYIYLGEVSKPIYQIQATGGLSATLNWAYADINRFALQLTINGLSIPKDVNINNLICIPNLMQNSGETLIPYSPESYPVKVDADRPGSPIEVTYLYVFRHPLDPERQKELDFDIHFRFGACQPAQWNDYTGPTPVPIPNIGTFQVSFQIPVRAGKIFHPGQSVSHNNFTINLNEIATSPSFVTARICFDPGQVKISDPAVVLVDAALEVNGMTIPNNSSAPTEPEKVTEGDYCQRVWFSSGVGDHSTKLILTVHQITFISGDQTTVAGPWVYPVE